MSDKHLTINALAVADFRTEHMDDSVGLWRVRNHIPFAESCARQIWFGSAETFKTFPIDSVEGHAVSLHFGAKAYQHLLRLNLGLLSRRHGETNIAGQFYNGWQQMHQDHPDKAKFYDQLVQQLTCDSRLIRHKIMSDWKMQDPELCARDLSGMQKGDSVLIVAHTNALGNVSPLTDMIARKVSLSENRRAREIAITHPDPEVLDRVFEELKTLGAQKKIASPLTRMEFGDLPIACELYDHMYVTLPMGHNPDADAHIIDCWKKRSATDNVLTHLRAAPENMAQTSDIWSKADLDNFIAPEAIRAEMAKRGRDNEDILRRAETAIEHCIECRLNGLQPSGSTLNNYTARPAPSCG